jgi:DNA mismatch endonuclease (patch repair protein)
MSDVFTVEKRSDIMRQVKSKNNKSTEAVLLKFFKDNHIIGWRRQYKISGKPDFAFPKLKLAIFCDGCFWHGHDCRNTKPKDNADYWTQKIRKNQDRDRLVNEKLKKYKWIPLRIWECQIKSGAYVDIINNAFDNFDKFPVKK